MEDSNQADELLDQIQKLVEQHGSRVGLYSAPCVVYRLEHETCRGCIYALGCCKLAVVYETIVCASSYIPTSLTDLVAMLVEAGEEMQACLEAKTLEEVVQWV
jgi:hypothetical protein